MNQEVFAAVADALEQGEPAALVTIVSTTGSTPQRVGAKMLVFPDGRMVGTIGGGCYENDAFWKAREAITNRKPQLVHYELDDDFAQETGLICGGQMSVYIEPIEPSPELYVIGAGHVGAHLATIAQDAGFQVHVIDDREKFASRERFPSVAEVVTEDIPVWLERTKLPSHAYVVIVTRGHTNDLDALRALCASAPLRLGAGGWMLCEHGYDQAPAVRALMSDSGLADVASWRDIAGIERVSGGMRREVPADGRERI